MLALRHRSDPTPPLAPLAGLVVRRETRASAMAALQQRAELEMQRRLDVRKSGFTPLAELSFDAAGRPALRPIVPGAARIASRLLGLPEASDTLTPCWRCVRAGRGAMYCAPGECRCDYQVPASGCAA
jgi:hypothetical protein